MAIAGAQTLLLCCDFLSQSNNSLNSISGILSFSAIILTKKRPTPAETNLQSLFGKVFKTVLIEFVNISNCTL